jgi:hypothetical protein
VTEIETFDGEVGFRFGARGSQPVVVAHDKAGVVVFLDSPGRREAAAGGQSATEHSHKKAA